LPRYKSIMRLYSITTFSLSIQARNAGRTRRDSADSADLVDESVVERLTGVEVASATHIFRDLFGRTACDSGQPRVESPEQVLVLLIVRGDLIRGSRVLRSWLTEPEARVRRRGAMAGEGHDTGRGPADLTSAMRAHWRAEHVKDVDENERGLERAVRAVEVDLDGLLSHGAEGQELRRGFAGQSVIELARDQDDPALEQLFL
jgi:hypothetical protein